MKHNLLTAANGLQTPIERSQRKSTTSSIHSTLLTSLLALFLLMVGNSAVWAGWRFQGQEANNGDGSWENGDNMTQVGSSDVWYYRVSNVSRTIEFKINNGSWDNENQKYYESNTDDQNQGNVPLVCGHDIDSKHRFRYEPSTIFGSNIARDLYVFVKGNAGSPSQNDKVWAIAVRPGSGTIDKQYSLRGDLWLNNGWAGTTDYNRNPVFVNMTNNVAAQVSYLIPIPSGSNAMKSRFTLVSAGTEKTADHYESESSNLTNNSDDKKYRLTIPANGGSYPTVKRIVLDYYPTNGYVRAHLEDYIVKRNGWHLYVDDKYMGAMDNAGTFTVENMASGEHTMYIANYSHNSINGSTYDPYNDNNGKVHAQQWFGGLFIDVNPEHSNVSFQNKSVYYDSSDSKFGPQTYPVAGQTNARGKFTISGTKDVTFSFDGGVITINAVDHAEAFTDEVYVYGAGGTNWVSGWSKPVEDYKMTISDGVASKTFYNVKGNGLNFKVWNKTTSSDIDWSKYSSSKSENITCSNCSSNNICFDLGSNVYDITVYTNGTEVWVKAKQHQIPGSAWRVTGTFNGWSKDNEQMSNDATNGCKTVTISNINKAYDKNGHGWIKFKIFEGTEWTNSIHADNSTVIGLDGTVIGTVADDNETADGRIIVQVDETSDITFSYYQYTGGANIVTVKRTAATPAEPDYQPWSGDSYRDWYLTGDFSKPGVFDDWVQNPSGYKFAADGDNHQKVSITLDPNDVSIFHDNSGHKLTRFEIIRQGTWDDPRINKPQFDATTSNCSLQTDWKDAGSNRMSLELTTKSVIEFDIWRWGTAPGSADRKVTVTITPVPQVTVTFMANSETFATQTFDKGGKASIPAGTPARSGYNFNGWDWDFNTTVNKNTTINAVWAYKAISSVVLNESTHMTWVGNTDFTLTPTYDPSDLITKTVAWSSDNMSVATVSNGTVHAEGAGSATITCTVTDQFDHQETATCEVTVAACEMATDNIYSMTVTGYNSSTGSSATLTGLWNSSEPATLTRCNVRVGNNNGTNDYYAYDNNGQVYADNDATHYWYLYASNSTVGLNPVYYVQDAATGKYMYMTTTFPDGQSTVNNPDWVTYPIMTGDKVDNNDNYLWYAGTGSGSKGVIVCYNGSKQADVSGSTQGQSSCIISRRHWTEAWLWSNSPTYAVGASHGAHQGGGGYTDMQSAFVNVENIPNPAYLASQMNTSYYRMNTNATVRANLAAPLVSGAVITVRLYADAATTVKLQKTDGTEIETINLTADTEREYSYAGSALVGESAFVIKASDNHAGIASIVVARTYVAHPSSPALAWETDLSGGVIRSVTGGTFQYTATSTEGSLGAITYTSLNPAVATVAADGTATPLTDGTTTITATIEANGCYSEQSITYSLTLSAATLAELIDATPVSGTLTLTGNYAEDAVIDKAITINGQGHTIGNLTVEQTGDLTLSSALTVNDFTICAKAGNTSIPAASGQVHNATNLTINGNAYFLYTVDPSGTVHYGWYDFTVPFPVNAASGIKGIQEGVLKENFAYGPDYAIMDYNGAKQAQGQYPYKKFSGVMQPNKLYSVTLDDDYNYNTLRMQKTAEGPLVASDNVTLNAYAGDATHQNWNGVGNGTLHHADAGVSSSTFIQVYQSGDKTFLPVNINEYSLVVGSAFMVQETGSMTLSQATHDKLLAPKRYATAPATAIQIASEGKPFSDQLFITASETGGQAYTPGVDVAKAGNIGNVNVPQIWTTAYDYPLCVHEAQLIDGQAQYNLSLYAPADGTYTLTSLDIPADYTLYLTQNGNTLCELSEPYTLDLNKGITTEYGLLLVETYKTPTDVDNISTGTDETKKILLNGILYIRHKGKLYNAQGASVR